MAIQNRKNRQQKRHHHHAHATFRQTDVRLRFVVLGLQNRQPRFVDRLSRGDQQVAAIEHFGNVFDLQPGQVPGRLGRDVIVRQRLRGAGDEKVLELGPNRQQDGKLLPGRVQPPSGCQQRDDRDLGHFGINLSTIAIENRHGIGRAHIARVMLGPQQSPFGQGLHKPGERRDNFGQQRVVRGNSGQVGKRFGPIKHLHWDDGVGNHARGR